MSVKHFLLRKLIRETRGAEIAEAAAVLPLMFMMLLGIFWFGQAFSIYGAITRAAQDGARAAAAPSCTTCTALTTKQSVDNAVSAVQAALTVAKLDPNQIVPSNQWATPTLLQCGSPSVVSCDSHGGNICVQTNVQLSSPSVGSCGISVSFEYPYQFWLPFTSLNKQKIQMQAVARVRTESQ